MERHNLLNIRTSSRNIHTHLHKSFVTFRKTWFIPFHSIYFSEEKHDKHLNRWQLIIKTWWQSQGKWSNTYRHLFSGHSMKNSLNPISSDCNLLSGSLLCVNKNAVRQGELIHTLKIKKIQYINCQTWLIHTHSHTRLTQQPFNSY